MYNDEEILKDIISKKWTRAQRVSAPSKGESIKYGFFIPSIGIFACLVASWVIDANEGFAVSIIVVPVYLVSVVLGTLARLLSSDWYCRVRAEREFSLKRKKNIPVEVIKVEAEMLKTQIDKAFFKFEAANDAFSVVYGNLNRADFTLKRIEEAKKGNIFHRILQPKLDTREIYILLLRPRFNQMNVRFSRMEKFFEEHQKTISFISKFEGSKVDDIQEQIKCISRYNWENFPGIDIEMADIFHNESEIKVKLEELEQILEACEKFVTSETVQ